MNERLILEIQELNPWLEDSSKQYLDIASYLPRMQQKELLDPEWDHCWTLLIGPRRAGKTTLGHYLSQELLASKRFEGLLYLNFDFSLLREAFDSPVLLKKILDHFGLKNPIVFLDDVQRLETPGLLLKAIADLKWPIKMIASGSSQLEIKSKVQEHLTGREIEALVLPLSSQELPVSYDISQQLLYGAYPQVVLTAKKGRVLSALYHRYISKDVIEILQVGKPAVLEKLLTLVAHSSGQLVHYQQMATDCRVSSPTVQHYLDLLEATYVLARVQPFVGNKRTEVTSNPIYYFIDNGFRNQALRNFQPLELRGDLGLLVEGLVFQELYKYKNQTDYDVDLFYWRTKSGAEVDFVLYKNQQQLIPVEVKYREMQHSKVTRGFRSFLQAYQPKQAVIITKSWLDQVEIEGCIIDFVPIGQLKKVFTIVAEVLH